LDFLINGHRTYDGRQSPDWRPDIDKGGCMRSLLAGLAFLVAAILCASETLAQASDAGPLVVQGLSGPVNIAIDRWGIPHISAANVEDAFFGQGYAAALMRLWQLDLNHRRELGRLAEVFGPKFVPYDHAARLFLYRGSLQAEWKMLDPRVEGIARSFVAGINARVKEVREDRSLLPAEFAALDMLPDFWTAEDLLRARIVTAPNIRAEVRRAELACKGALEFDGLVQPLDPPRELAVPKGLDPCSIDEDEIHLYTLLTAPLPLIRARGSIKRGDAEPSIELPSDIDARAGSNAWVIAPSRTTTGRPILANDPHLPFTIPSPRMVTHLSAPGFDVIGAGPVLRPGVQVGHTDRIAFGRTDLQIDQEDIYVLDLRDDGLTYQGPHGPEPIERVTETIAVRGHDPISVDLAYTELGPIIFESRERKQAVVIRAASMQPGAVVNLEYVPTVLARNWSEFRAAIRYAVWGTNFLYADIDGNIAWQAAGRVPLRANHDGLMPVPASGDYPWTGILPIDQMPGEFNPERGWIVSANQMPFPPGWPVADRRISFEWGAPTRYRRLIDQLPHLMPHAPIDSWMLQEDVYSSRASVLIDLLARTTETMAAEERSLLLNWNREVSADSSAAALFEFWMYELQKETRQLLVPAPLLSLLPTLHPNVLLSALTTPDGRFGAEPQKSRDRLLLSALAAASAELKLHSPSGQTLPTWGEIHQVSLRHALTRQLPPELAENAIVTGHGSGGDNSTVAGRWWQGPQNGDVVGGASYRVVFDVGNWDEALFTMGPGQAGSPGNPHFRDLYDLWLDNIMIPLSFSPNQVAHVTSVQNGEK
jgi:penicillin G amidase